MTTNPPQIVFNHIVAFEVSKDTLVVHTLPDDEQCTIDNKPQAVRRLIKAEIKRNRNKQIGQMLVICEATGGYERHVLDVALEMGLSVHRAHGRACGTLATTAVCLPRLIRSMRA
jgi:transposase